MRRQGLINLALLLLVLVLSLLVWFSPGQQEVRSLPPLTELDPAAIKQIEISNHNGPRYIMQRTAQGWRMTEPYQLPANGPRIDLLLALLTTPQLEAFSLPTDRLPEFGLDHPQAELTFNQTRIIFGGTHPFNHHRYVRIGDQLTLIQDRFPHHALARAEAFLDHALFPQMERIRAIKTQAWRLFRQADRWQLEPAIADISADQLRNKIEAWQQARAARVIQAPHTSPNGEITIELEGETAPQRWSVIRQGGGILLVRPDLGLAYQLASEHLLTAPGSTD